MPAPVLPPQTSKQAKRAYQKSGKVFKFTASQERAAKQRNARDEYARKLRQKEDKAKNNKRQRDEKEQREREAKKRLIERGALPADALLPKVNPSQSRLNLFLRPATKSSAKAMQPLPTCDEDEETVESDIDNEEETLVNDNQATMLSLPKMDETLLEDIVLIAPSEKEDKTADEKNNIEEFQAQSPAISNSQGPKWHTPKSSKSELEDWLGCPLSQAMSDFEICEDPLSGSEQAQTVSPSPLKRKRSQDVFITPSKSLRSALSEMSPAKVLQRSQEKPDTTSAPPRSARMLSPERDQISSDQGAQEVSGTISTQDIANGILSSASKENTDPGRALCLQKKSITGSQVKAANKAIAGPSKSALLMEQPKEDYDHDDSLFDDLMDTNELEDYDVDVTDAEWAGLSTRSPKNTAVSSFGSPKKARAVAVETPEESLTHPSKRSAIAELVTKLKAVSPKKCQAPTATEHKMASASLSFNFEDDISDAELASLSAQLLPNAHDSPANTTTSRFAHSPKSFLLGKLQAPAAVALQTAPTASQSFGLNDGMDDYMLALVDAFDVAGSSATDKAKKGRTLPWQTRPAN